VALLAAFAVLIPQYSGLSAQNFVRLGWPGLKVPDVEYRWAEAVNQSVPGGSHVLVPTDVGAWIVTFHHHVFPLVVRSYLHTTKGALDAEELLQRNAMQRFVDTPNLIEATPQQFRDGLDRFAVRAVCLRNSPSAATARAILEQAGFRQARRDEDYELWVRARAVTTQIDMDAANGGTEGLYLLVTMPALNEERTVGEVIRGVPRTIPGVRRIEVLVVDDGSEDRTAAEAELAGARVIRHAAIRGVGGAFHSALNYGLENGADLIVSLDADGQFNPADIPGADRAGGGRRGGVHHGVALQGSVPHARDDLEPTVGQPDDEPHHLVADPAAASTTSPAACAATAAARPLQLYLLARFTYTQEVFLNLAFREVRIKEVPIRVRGVREFGQSRVAGSLPRYALRTATIIIRSYRDYWPLQFFGMIALGLFARRDWVRRLLPLPLSEQRSVPPAHLGRGGGRRLRRPGGVGDPHRTDRRHAQSPPHLPGGVALPAAKRRAGDADAPG
jgi:hypothetical protein